MKISSEMAKNIFSIICLIIPLFGTSHSDTINCQYKNESWSTVGRVYVCKVLNLVNITTLEAAYIDSVTGTHIPGQSIDNVQAWEVNRGVMHYIPRNLKSIFKNLKAIAISYTDLKEIHQADFKPFPDLIGIWMHTNQLEIIEEGLFDFNPNLDHIYLYKNKIFHIDSKVFDNLTKLRWLYLQENVCINMKAEISPIALQNVTRAVKLRCTNTDYVNLEKKVKNFELESNNFDPQTFNEKFKILENEVKSSRFSSFFQRKLQEFGATQGGTGQETTTKIPETTKNPQNETCLTQKSRLADFVTNLKELVAQAPSENDNDENKIYDETNGQCLALNENISNLNVNIEKLNEKSSSLSGTSTKIDEKLSSLSESIESKLEIFEENLNSLKSFSYEKIDKIQVEVKAAHSGIVKSTNKGIDRIEKKFEEMDEKFAKIMKALNIEE